MVRYGTEVRAGYECFCTGFGCLFAFYLFLCLFLHLLTLLFRKNMPSATSVDCYTRAWEALRFTYNN